MPAQRDIPGQKLDRPHMPDLNAEKPKDDSIKYHPREDGGEEELDQQF